jgi:hypothetical protein
MAEFSSCDPSEDLVAFDELGDLETEFDDVEFAKSIGFKSCNVVVNSPLSSPILDLAILSRILTIWYVPFTVGAKKIGVFRGLRDSVPFFGHNGVLVGVKYDNLSRGIVRKSNAMPKMVALDFQICNKNVHMRISRGNIHQTGAPNMEVAEQAATEIIEYITMCTNNLQLFRNLSLDDQQRLVNRVAEACFDQDGIPKKGAGRTSSNGQSEISDDFDDLERSPDKSTYYYVESFALEAPNSDSFYDQMDYLLNLPLPPEDNLVTPSARLLFAETPIPVSLTIATAHYGYGIGRQLVLWKLSQLLKNFTNDDGSKKYDSKFDNMLSRKEFTVELCIDAIYKHTMVIHQSGLVFHHSPLPAPDTFEVACVLVLDIRALVDDDEYKMMKFS